LSVARAVLRHFRTRRREGNCANARERRTTNIMMKRFGVAAALVGCVVGCSAAEPGDASGEETSESSSAITRADSTGGPRSAVAVVGLTIFGGHRYCSGVVVAPRVVITAAHCLTDIVERTIVYYGDDVTADQDQFPGEDDASKPWAVAESWAQHPDYDADLHFPDLAAVYLPRELPIEPAELARFALRSSDIGESMTISGWGASRALTPDLSQFEGIGVQRTAKVPFLGSPKASDFVPEDPNNGLFVPAIRAKLAKFDGRAPESNSCAGDSGAPIFSKRGNQKYVTAINFFTGLSCEGYSMATRVEPFLPYFEDVIAKGGNSPVLPQLRCVDEAADGSLTAFFGYDNQNVVSVDIPLGRDNQLREDALGVRPTHFLPGEHAWDFFVGFSKRDKLKYELRSEGEHCRKNSQSVSASSRSPRCDATAPDVSCAKLCQGFDACGFDFGDCMTDCTSNIPFFQQELPQCLAPWVALNRCMGALPSEDLCNFSSPPSCVAEMAAYEACFL
jgi:hypothetical protein